MADTTYNNFLKDPDQTSRRAELAAFIGPNPTKFFKFYDQQVTHANRSPDQLRTANNFLSVFLWPPLLIGPFWLFYRKMWKRGAVICGLLLPLILIKVAGPIGLAVGVILGRAGAILYLRYAITTIEKLRRQTPDRPLDPHLLAQAGGVSLPGAIACAVAYGVAAFLIAYLLIHNGYLK